MSIQATRNLAELNVFFNFIKSKSDENGKLASQYDTNGENRYQPVIQGGDGKLTTVVKETDWGNRWSSRDTDCRDKNNRIRNDFIKAIEQAGYISDRDVLKALTSDGVKGRNPWQQTSDGKITSNGGRPLTTFRIKKVLDVIQRKLNKEAEIEAIRKYVDNNSEILKNRIFNSLFCSTENDFVIKTFKEIADEFAKLSEIDESDKEKEHLKLNDEGDVDIEFMQKLHERVKKYLDDCGDDKNSKDNPLSALSLFMKQEQNDPIKDKLDKKLNNNDEKFRDTDENRVFLNIMRKYSYLYNLINNNIRYAENILKSITDEANKDLSVKDIVRNYFNTLKSELKNIEEDDDFSRIIVGCTLDDRLDIIKKAVDKYVQKKLNYDKNRDMKQIVEDIIKASQNAINQKQDANLKNDINIINKINNMNNNKDDQLIVSTVGSINDDVEDLEEKTIQ